MNDEQLDKLLHAQKVQASADFTERALKRILAQEKSQTSLDKFCDNLLVSQKIKTTSNFTERTLKTIRQEKRVPLLQKIIGITSSLGVAACIGISVVTLQITQADMSENAYAEMTELNSEISALAAFIYEQELDSFNI